MGDAKEQTIHGAQGEESEDDYDHPTYKALKALETVAIIPEAPERGKRCGICSEELSIGYKATKLPCAHLFPEFNWLREHRYCSVCRYKLPDITSEFLGYCNACENEYLFDPSPFPSYDCSCPLPSNSTSS